MHEAVAVIFYVDMKFSEVDVNVAKPFRVISY